MIDGFSFKDVYGIGDLLQIMQCLRSEGGCPWDREQTHESIKKNLIEETYEVIEAINQQDKALLCEELGDVLMQVVFHAQMEAEEGSFTFENVADGVCKKLIERHPHVFGEVEVTGSEEVLRNWDDIKKRSKGQTSQTETMLSVPRELPALMRAEKVQKRAADVGFDWESAQAAFYKIGEEAEELSRAVENASGVEEEAGDLLFAGARLAADEQGLAHGSKGVDLGVLRAHGTAQAVKAVGEKILALAFVQRPQPRAAGMQRDAGGHAVNRYRCTLFISSTCAVMLYSWLRVGVIEL